MRQEKHTDEIAICIINFHQRQLTLNCLQSLKQQSDKRFFVYLLDNDTKGEISSTDLQAFPFVTYTSSAINTGFAGGNNILIKQALKNHHPYILLLNNDTEVSPSCVETFRNTLQSANAMDIVGCVITYLKKPQQIWFAGGRLYPGVHITQHTHMDKSLSALSHTKLITTDWITGCALGASEKLYQAIGYLDESFFAYLEDLDFCLKAKRKGGRCIVINRPLVKHAVSPAIGKIGTNTMTNQRIIFQAKNSAYIIHRHFPCCFKLQLFGNCLFQCGIFLIKQRMTITQIPLFFSTAFTAL